MGDREGAVVIQIVADDSGLGAQFTQANQKAQQAGAAMASAFGAGARTQVIQTTQEFNKLWTAADGVNFKLKETDQSQKAFSQGTKDLFAKVESLNQNLKESKDVLAEVQAAFKAGTASAQDLARAEQEVANAARQTQGEVQSVVGLIPGLGRAAEHFINLVPGLGTAILAAFPVLGFIALAQSVVQIGSSIASAMEKMTGLEEAEKNLQQENKKTEESFKSMIQTIDRLNVSGIGRDFGGAAGQRAEANLIRQQIQDAQQQITQGQQKIQSLATVAGSLVNHPILLVPKYGADFAKATEDNIKAEGDKIVDLQNKIREQQKALHEKGLDAEKAQATESAALSLAAVHNEIAALDRASEAKRKTVEADAERQRSAARQDADKYQNAATRASIIADAEVEIARKRSAALKAIEEEDLKRRESLVRREASLEGAGQTPNAIAVIQTTAAGKVEAMHEATAEKEKALDETVTQAVEKSLEDRVTLRREYEKEIAALAESGRKFEVHEQEETDKQLKTANRVIFDNVKRLEAIGKEIRRVNEHEARTEGLAVAHDSNMGRLEQERAYALQASRTASQQIATARELSYWQEKAIADQLDGAIAARAALDPMKDKERIATEDERIQKLKNDLGEKQYSDDTKLLRLQKDLSIQGQIQLGIMQAEDRAIREISSGIASAIVDHKSIGSVFKNAAKDLEKGIIDAITGALLKAAKDKIFDELAKVLPKTGIIAKIAAALGIGVEDPVKQQIAALKAETAALDAHKRETVKLIATDDKLDTATKDLTGAVRDLIAEMAACCACSCDDSHSNKPGVNNSPVSQTPAGSKGGFGPYTTSGFDPLGSDGSNDAYGNRMSGTATDLPASLPIGGGTRGGASTTVTYGDVVPEMASVPSMDYASAVKSVAQPQSSSYSDSSTGDMHFHAHGMTDPDKFLRVVAQKLPALLKARSPVFSPQSQGAR